jgi:hypothetical protein
MSGRDICEIAPKTPRGALHAALRIAGHIEQASGMGLASLFAAAVRADGGDPDAIDWQGDDAAHFGSDLAMMAMGTGVSWFDDHAEFALVVPHCAEGIAYRAHGRWGYE